MPYNEYKEPGVDVVVENREPEIRSRNTNFFPVFIGTGVTTRDKTIVKEGITANVTNFPEIELRMDLIGELNTDLLKETVISIETLTVNNETQSYTLTKETDFEIVSDPVISSFDNYTEFTINITNPGEVTDQMTLYDADLKISNVEDAFDLKLVRSHDRFNSSQRFGPPVLKENDNEFLNDTSIAAEIAFRTGVTDFFYVEVPRDYGSEPTKEDYREVIEKVYYKTDAYRIVPLTTDPEINELATEFVLSSSNPLDKRETVAFVSSDTEAIVNHNDIEELVEKVGGYSQSIKNERVMNIYCGESVELKIQNSSYVLPPYFMSVAVASLDSTVGLVQPLSKRRITVFEKINGPRFRPREWNELAKRGVFIVMKDFDNGDGIIRHQLTTSDSTLPEYQEYSMVKNFDVVTKRLRDRFSPYAGQENVTTGYIEKLNATMTTASQEIIESGLARTLEVTTSWRQRDNEERSLYTRVMMGPAYPGNNLDIYLVL